MEYSLPGEPDLSLHREFQKVDSLYVISFISSIMSMLSIIHVLSLHEYLPTFPGVASIP